eukprot:COSAG01_NODE_6041_length_3882_cov_27.246630_6_plen_98_part_00
MLGRCESTVCGKVPEFAQAVGAGAQIFALLDHEPAVNYSGGLRLPLGFDRGGVRINFDAVRFRYPARPEQPVLRGLSLLVKPKQTVALVGSSGAGKS